LQIHAMSLSLTMSTLSFGDFGDDSEYDSDHGSISNIEPPPPSEFLCTAPPQLIASKLPPKPPESAMKLWKSSKILSWMQNRAFSDESKQIISTEKYDAESLSQWTSEEYITVLQFNPVDAAKLYHLTKGLKEGKKIDDINDIVRRLPTKISGDGRPKPIRQESQLRLAPFLVRQSTPKHLADTLEEAELSMYRPESVERNFDILHNALVHVFLAYGLDIGMKVAHTIVCYAMSSEGEFYAEQVQTNALIAAIRNTDLPKLSKIEARNRLIASHWNLTHAYNGYREENGIVAVDEFDEQYFSFGRQNRNSTIDSC